MPLIHSPSNKAREKNIKREIAAGHPLARALATAYSVQRKAKSKATKSK